MPTATFHRLDTKKKQSIIHASLDEFSCLPYAEVSLNQIIKKANISRGSFYLYFEDKLDLYNYLMEVYWIEPFQQFHQQLSKQANLNDYLFSCLTWWMDYNKTKDDFFVQMMQSAPHQCLQTIWGYIDQSLVQIFKQHNIERRLRYHSDKERQMMALFYRTILWQHLTLLTLHEEDLEEAKMQLSKQAVMLQIGVYK